MKKEFKIGLFAVVVLVVSFFVLNYLRGEDIFNREAEYVAMYSNAEGLVASAPVFVKGYKAGKVTEVKYDTDKGMFSVVCSVSKDFPVPDDSKMTIYSVDIMGGRGLRLDLGTSEVMAEDGDTLQANYEAGLMDALAGGIAPLMEKVGNALDSLEVTVAGLNRLVSEANAASLKRTLAHVESVMSNLQSLSGKIEGKSDEITAMIDSLAVFSGSLTAIASQADSTLAGVNTAVASLNDADLTGTVASLHQLLNKINDPEGTVGKLLVDDSIYNSVDSLLVNIDRFVDKIQENPKKYLKISVF